MRPNVHSLTLLTLSAALAVGAHASAEAIEPERLGVIGLRTVDVDGNVVRIAMKGGPGPAAIVFLDPGCPIARRYAPVLDALAERAAERGVDFYPVVSDPTVTPADVRAFCSEFELDTPCLIDADGELAARLGPRIVPEAFVISANDTLAYRGRIDDRFADIGRPRAKTSHHDLRDAIDRANGPELTEPVVTEPVGCDFEAWDAREASTEVTYWRDVAPILTAHCVECHRDGSVGPFGLDTYASAKRRARMIARVSEERLMPPWRAEIGFGSFRDEHALGDRQIETLRAWASGGAPEGDAEHALPAPDWPTGEWRLGEPDLVLPMAEAFPIPAKGEDIYRYFVLEPRLPRDVVVTAMDFLPGDPSVVHHMNSFVDYSGRARAKDAEDDEPGFSVFGTGGFFDYSGGTDDVGAIGGWAPGVDPYQLPAGHGIALPAGGELVIEVHYHLSGRATEDLSRVGLYFAKEPVEHYLDGLVIGTVDLEIPEGGEDYARHVWMKVPADMRVTDVMPHMHSIGRSMKAIVTQPDGEVVPLISIPRWDLRWQNIYALREPLFVPKGSRIDVWFHFDNSATNPANPFDPPQPMGWGWGTNEEMAELWMGIVPSDPATAWAIHAAEYAAWMRSGAVTRAEPR
ncbi:MAG: redoxin family protein [Planctomycetota bacterium]